MNSPREDIFWDLIDVLDKSGFLRNIMVVGCDRGQAPVTFTLGPQKPPEYVDASRRIIQDSLHHFLDPIESRSE